MKDSGIPWIGEIPNGWACDAIGSLYSVRIEKVSDKDYPPLSVGKMGVVPQLDTAAKTDDGDNRKLVRKGDFAINSRSDRRGSCGISEYDGSVSLINTILTPRNRMNPKFYNWLFHSERFADEFYRWGHGIVDDLWTTRWQEMKRISIVVPPLQEQQAIADFLDKKCSEIDELISLQEKIIEELKAYKQSVITEAVTKGLNPDAPMKDSGNVWIGEIPERWDTCRVKNIISVFVNGYAFDSNVFKLDDEVPVIRIGDIQTNIDFDNCVKVPYSDNLNAFLIQNGDVLIAMSGATTGKCCLVLSDRLAYINQRVGILRGRYSHYLFYALQADYFLEYVSLNSAGSAQPNISGGSIGNFIIAVPNDLKMCDEIADYLDKKCSEIDSLIALKEDKIEYLKEYKKSIIYEYTTGKKEVIQ